MGWFSAEPAKPTPSTDGAFEAPNRSSRAHCWESRDAYFRCLDRNNIIDSLKDQDLAIQRCSSESKGLDTNCASSWVSERDPPFRLIPDDINVKELSGFCSFILAYMLYAQVQYFKKRRVAEYNKAQTIKDLEAKGAQRLPGQ